jgi:ParB/RepB/Spo0J family partition protein
MKIKFIDYSDIKPDINQPRKIFKNESLQLLKLSIKNSGIEQPLIVRKDNQSYIIIDGERRWRASKGIIKKLPCIIKQTDNKIDILEQQLRTDCLKEELNVDELDRAIYRYYEHYISNATSCVKKSNRDNGYTLIGNKIGKSRERVKIAIDRYDFKNEFPEFKKKEKKDGFNFINSTIAQTKKTKDKEIRVKLTRAAIELKTNNEIKNIDVKKTIPILNEMPEKRNISEKEIKQHLLNKAKERKEKEKEEKKIIQKPDIPKQEKPDILDVYSKSAQRIIQEIVEFRTKGFLKFKEHLDFKELIKILNDFLKQLENK